ncbi:MAG: hypothetical protein RI926_904 [Actinomycetota bacterium]|jgi:hypothetical protein
MIPAAPALRGEVIAMVTSTFDSTFERIANWRDVLVAYTRAHDGVVTAASLDSLVESLVRHEFGREGALVVGAGFVAHPQFLKDAQWHLAWWLGTTNTFDSRGRLQEVRRLEAEENPRADNFRDYTTLEWWRVPEKTARRHITGPYVDYLCTDEYTLTLTMPVFWKEIFVGVVGADLYARDIESILFPKLKALGRSGTLVNSSARVVVSSDPNCEAGSLFRIPGLSDVLRAVVASEGPASGQTLDSGHVVIACSDTSLSLVIDPVT